LFIEDWPISNRAMILHKDDQMKAGVEERDNIDFDG
jgi:hypothetical protein